jgi:hypothetical protein
MAEVIDFRRPVVKPPRSKPPAPVRDRRNAAFRGHIARKANKMISDLDRALRESDHDLQRGLRQLLEDRDRKARERIDAVIAEIAAIRDEVNGTPPEDDPPAASWPVATSRTTGAGPGSPFLRSR